MNISEFQDQLFLAGLKANDNPSVVRPEYTKKEMLNIYHGYVHNHRAHEEVKEDILLHFRKDFG